MQQELFELFAAQASEAEAFNFLTQGPETQSLYFSIANRAKEPADETYADIWRSKAAIAQLLHQRQLGTLASADERTRKLGEELLETRRRVARLLLAPGAGPSHLQQLKDLSRRKEELERQLAQALPELAGRRGANLDPREMQC
jgi:hypothetical protein